MVVKVTAPDIVDKVTTGAEGATLINDSKRAINQLVDGKEDALGSPRVNDWVLSSSTDKVRKWTDMSGEAISYKLDNALGSTAWRTSTDTGGGGGGSVVGALTWGTPLPLFQGLYPVLPDTTAGSTWSHTVAVDDSLAGFNVPAVAFDTLLPKGGYVEVEVEFTEGAFQLIASNSLPTLSPIGGEPAAEFFSVVVELDNVSITTALGTYTIPNSAGVTSFGIRAMQASAKPQILISGVAHEIDISTFPEYLSLSTVFIGPIGGSVSCTFDTGSTINEDPSFIQFIHTFDSLTELRHPSTYGNSLSYASSTSLESAESTIPYLVSPKVLNKWLDTTRALTQGDIDNATSTKGTVSGEQLAALGGGGGPEVLKDWTTVHSGDAINFLEGLTIANLDTIQVEVRRLATTTEVVYIEVRNSSSALITPTVKNSSRRLFGGVNFEVLSNIPVFFRGRFGGGSKNRVSEGVLNFDISTSGTQISITTQAKGYGTDGNTLQLAYLHDSQQTYATTDFAYVGFTPVTNQSYSFRVLQLEA